ncbi:MAG: Vi polysaccharide biosynthesis protein VipB/TviC [candidate division Zixibacteria bacterium RBG_16_48_11]|nr:MAG: Vi polysaccharide biosynthesis protein VipB/TviC [candidate division Zixibacteria bacterium RBG_16_48_11]
MSIYLVTGGAGFIGSHIVAELVKRKQVVRVLDNFSTGRRQNLSECWDKLEVIEGDIRDYPLVKEVTKGVDFLLHQAALPSVERSIKDPLTTNQVNVNGTLNLLEASKLNRIKVFVMASSSSVYGNTPKLPKKEKMLPDPLSPYALSKLAGERYCRLFHELYGLNTVCLRYFNVFGPKQDPNSHYAAVIPRFILAIVKGERPTIYGDGKQSRDFTYVDNVVKANLLACENRSSWGEVFNIACGRRFSVNRLYKTLSLTLGNDLKPFYTKPRPGDVRHSLADISKSKKILKYSIQVDFKSGLKQTVNWFLTNRAHWEN